MSLSQMRKDCALSDEVPAETGRKMRFSGITILNVVNGKIVEENGLDDGVTALTQQKKFPDAFCFDSATPE
jgi:predicted ester cyclase